MKLGDVHLSVLGPRVRLFQPDVQLLDLVLHILCLQLADADAHDAGDADADDADANNEADAPCPIIMLRKSMLNVNLALFLHPAYLPDNSFQSPFFVFNFPFSPLSSSLLYLVFLLPPPCLLLRDLQLLLVLADCGQLLFNLHHLQSI